MIKFDLEKALAGDKVVNNIGDEQFQCHAFKDAGERNIGCVRNGQVYVYMEDELFMAPKQLSGFVNVYASGAHSYHATLKDAKGFGGSIVARIDLSQFPEGYGL